MAPLEGHLCHLWGYTRGSGSPWPAVAGVTQAQVSPPSPTYRALLPCPGQHKTQRKATWGQPLWPARCPSGSSAPCPSYLVCPSVGPAAGSASPSACTGEAGAGANRAVAAEQVPAGDPDRLPGPPRARGRVTGRLDGVASRAGHSASLQVEMRGLGATQAHASTGLLRGWHRYGLAG